MYLHTNQQIGFENKNLHNQMWRVFSKREHLVQQSWKTDFCAWYRCFDILNSILLKVQWCQCSKQYWHTYGLLYCLLYSPNGKKAKHCKQSQIILIWNIYMLQQNVKIGIKIIWNQSSLLFVNSGSKQNSSSFQIIIMMHKECLYLYVEIILSLKSHYSGMSCPWFKI